MSASKLQESVEVRIAHSLHSKEKEFLFERRNTVFQSLQKLEINCSKDAVPNIALLGSGGGQRAMVGLLGSLVQLDKAGLLDCILYLSGVSGSTWCMASLYQEPDWSTKLETVTDKIIRRLSGPGVSWGDALAKLKKYLQTKDHFSLTDVWAVMVITTYVKEIDECKLSEQWDQCNKVPFPIYTLIDMQSQECKTVKGIEDPWFEISPLEAGYSLSGAFVKTSSFGSQFDSGTKTKPQDEMDMLYLQALCGSALADKDEIRKYLWQKITGKAAFEDSLLPKVFSHFISCYYIQKDFSFVDDHTETKLDGDKQQLNLEDKEAAKHCMDEHTENVCDLWMRIREIMGQWIWGRKYDFLHNLNDETLPSTLLESETRDYKDAGLLLNSPYFSVLRKERNIDLIISLDFSDGDPFMTVREAAEICKKRSIPFPEVNIPSEDLKNPKDFYVFKGTNTPTVIHMPLFNVVNCGDDIEMWRKKYITFKDPYSTEMITDLMEVAGKNISNNREKLLEQIGAAVGQKGHN
ncbi:cytosolic phospholipase A2 gamma-like [Carassius carassius]|uniref:cytosolic phospholipase A2 gamma-like n=1 Tax=Carassius carassius TaxID=217509 RepID=UPI002868F4F2|nr:cytosolic phospholipase A2 gamma-like [Carassius carassius]